MQPLKHQRFERMNWTTVSLQFESLEIQCLLAVCESVHCHLCEKVEKTLMHIVFHMRSAIDALLWICREDIRGSSNDGVHPRLPLIVWTNDHCLFALTAHCSTLCWHWHE